MSLSAGQLLELVKGEARGCKDMACLTEASAVLCHLASLHADVSKQSLRALLVLLCNRFPKVSSSCSYRQATPVLLCFWSACCAQDI